MQIWAESRKSALPICNYSQILYQFLTFTQNLKRSQKIPTKPINTSFVEIYLFIQTLPKGSIIKSKMLILCGIPPYLFHLMLLFSYRF